MSEDVIESHPLRLLKGDDGLPTGEVSLLLARSGVGKSAALINFALEEILQARHVYHFSAGMPSEKTHQYYQKILGDYARSYAPEAKHSYDEAYHHFTVISYLDPNKMIADMASEIDTLMAGTEIKPSLIVVDGLDFNNETSAHMKTMNEIAQKHGIKMLTSLRIHRTGDGELDLDGPKLAAKNHASHIYWLEPADRDHINLEFIAKDGNHLLPVYFCPHKLIFCAS